ncbi:MAG: 30S ribosomal protein S20 [Desulfobacterales bacterium]|nr:30S ribosomal protein S20 [Desulfobacterales bacterium]
MANHKSALKRVRQSQLRRERNKANRTRVKNAVKAVDAAVEIDKSVEKARSSLKAAIPVIAGVAAKGTFHKKTAARKISRLTRRVNKLARSTESAA